MTKPTEPAWLARALRPVTEVRQGEAITALLLTLNVFLMLTAYYFVKPVREALILAMSSGAEYKSYMSGAIAALLFLIVPAYDKLVDSFARHKLVIYVTLAFGAQLLLFYAAMAVPSLRAGLGLIFYAWVGVYSVMIIAQFWAFANDLYEREQGDRLFPLVAIGGSVGAAVGSKGADVAIRGVGIPNMLLIAAGLLGLCATLFWLVHRREQRDGDAGSGKTEAGTGKNEEAQSQPSRSGGFRLVLSHRYLLLIALFALVYNWVNTNGEYMLSKLIKADVAEAVSQGKVRAEDTGNAIGAAYANFFFYVNVAGVLLQTFVVSRVVKWLGLSKAFLFLPALALGNAAIFAFAPIVTLVKIGKTAENATDYSLNNTLKQMLWLVTSPDMKFKAKQVVDTFCVRIGDVCSAISVYLAVDLLGFSVQRFAWLSLALAGTWLALAVGIGRLHDRIREGKEQLTT